MAKFAKVQSGKIVAIGDKKQELTPDEKQRGVTVTEVDDNAQVGQDAPEGDAAS